MAGPGGPGRQFALSAYPRGAAAAFPARASPGPSTGRSEQKHRADATPEDHSRRAGQALDSGSSVSQPGPSAGPREALEAGGQPPGVEALRRGVGVTTILHARQQRGL